MNCGSDECRFRISLAIDNFFAPITGLNAVNSSPARLRNITYFTATIGAGSNALYVWDFGDGQTASGAQVNHRYAQTGAYTATVTATNDVGSINAATLVTIEPEKIYLPLTLKQ